MKAGRDGKQAAGRSAPGGGASPASTIGKRTLVEASDVAPLQEKVGVGGVGTAGPPPSGGGGAPLAPDLRARMEAAIGGTFAAVRVHEHSYAHAIGAQAFTRGLDVFFAPGRFDPSTPTGLALIGHELTHVKQQAEGRVPVTAQIGGAPANADPALEAEADALGEKAAHGEVGHGAAGAQAVSGAAPVQAKADDAEAEPIGTAPRVEAVEGDAGHEGVAGGPPIQRAPKAKPKRDFVPIKVPIARTMTRDEFKEAATRQIFGGVVVPAEWHLAKHVYAKEDSPIDLQVEVSLLIKIRGAANAAKGVDTDATGSVAGAEARAKDFQAQPRSDEKSALLTEIDRRYQAAIGGEPGKIAPGETAKAKLWLQIRDEVLFQQHHLANLPDNVKALIHQSVNGKALTPSDYDQLFRISKKIEGLPPGAAADYASKITGSTADLSVFEAAIDQYQSDLAARTAADDARTEVQNKLLGLEAVYALYQQYLVAAGMAAVSPVGAAGMAIAKKLGAKVETAADLRAKLEAQLPRYGFPSIAAFAEYIAKFEQAFEDGAVRITLDILEKYAGKLYKEQQRYADPAVVKDLHGKLGGFRTEYADFADNAKIWNDYAAQHNSDAKQEGLPGNGGIHAKPPTPAQAKAKAKAEAARASAEATIKGLSTQYPIFAEDDLPVEKRLNKERLAQASESELAGVLHAHIADRQAVVVAARGQLEGKHELVYKMDKLMPAFYAGMDIQPGSIHDQIIRDKMHRDAIAKLVVGILAAIAAVALTVVSLGAATPVIVAAGASIGAAGLSTYMAYDEYKQYTAEHAIADAGFADDPSVIWLVLAIVGAGVDMAAAAKAVRALAPAAKALEAGGEVSDFAKAVEALQKTKQLDEKIAAAADKAAAARKAYAAAKGDLAAALGKVYSLPGPFTDPEVYKALIKMAVAKVREGGHSLASFIAEIKQARLAQKLAELAPEELAKAKQAWETAERLGALVKDSVLLEKLLAKIGDAGKLERMLHVFPDPELEKIVDTLAHADRIPLMLEHVGADNTGKLVRQWMAQGEVAKANSFLERLSAGVNKELAETAGVGTKSIIIDSNTAIALMKDADPALKLTMNNGEIARVAYIKSLPPDTELRIGNMTVGEAGGALNLKGVPLDALRDSPEYAKVLNKLSSVNVGGPGGVADQILVADAFFAKAAPGVTPKFLTGDKKVLNRLAEIAGIDINKLGGKQALLAKYGKTGFNVTVESRTITVIPVP